MADNQDQDVYVPGILRCAKCEFQLVRSILSASTGDVRPGTSETEPCPNGCGPLWPVTWKQHAIAIDESWKAYVANLSVTRQSVREPTETMLKAGDDVMRKWIPMPTYEGEYHDVLRDVFKAMQGAFLNPPKGTN